VRELSTGTSTPSDADDIVRLLSVVAKNTLWTFTATTQWPQGDCVATQWPHGVQPPVQLTQVQPKRTTGWSLSLDPCFAWLDTQFGDKTRGHGQRTRPTARRRAGNPQLFTRPINITYRQPEPGLRPQHHPSQLWLIKPRAPERFVIASPGPRCASATCCTAQN
jgi:hypothetical protein